MKKFLSITLSLLAFLPLMLLAWWPGSDDLY